MNLIIFEEARKFAKANGLVKSRHADKINGIDELLYHDAEKKNGINCRFAHEWFNNVDYHNKLFRGAFAGNERDVAVKILKLLYYVIPYKFQFIRTLVTKRENNITFVSQDWYKRLFMVVWESLSRHDLAGKNLLPNPCEVAALVSLSAFHFIEFYVYWRDIFLTFYTARELSLITTDAIKTILVDSSADIDRNSPILDRLYKEEQYSLFLMLIWSKFLRHCQARGFIKDIEGREFYTVLAVNWDEFFKKDVSSPGIGVSRE